MHLLSDFKINSGRQHIRLNILVDRSVIVLVGPPLRVQRTSCFIENCRHRTQPVRVIFPAPTRLPTPAPGTDPFPTPAPGTACAGSSVFSKMRIWSPTAWLQLAVWRWGAAVEEIDRIPRERTQNASKISKMQLWKNRKFQNATFEKSESFKMQLPSSFLNVLYSIQNDVQQRFQQLPRFG